MPITRNPQLIASMVADAITPLMPGAGPPPTRIASVSLMRAILRRPSLRSFFSSEVANPLEDPLRNGRELACIAVCEVKLVVRRTLVIREGQIPGAGARRGRQRVVCIGYAAARRIRDDERRGADNAPHAEGRRIVGTEG